MAQAISPSNESTLATKAVHASPSLLTQVGQVITPYLPVFFAAFIGVLIATPIVRRIALKHNIVDRPNEARKIHKEPIAYLGGVAIFLGWLLGVGAGTLINPHPDDINHVEFPLSVVVGAVAILCTGLFDDVFGISPRVKIGGQLFAAAALATGNVGTSLVSQSIRTVQDFAISPLPLPDTISTWLMAEPNSLLVYLLGTFTIAAIVIGACNAVNLIDGMDGLAAGTSSISATGFLLISATLAVTQPFETVDPVRIVMSLAMLGCLLGFLPYNFNPANIFMGDAGSLLVGYMAAASMLLFSYNTDGGALKYTTACLLLLAFPITDTSLAIFRRKIAGKPLSAPDSQHIHHILKKAGFGVKSAVLILYAGSLVFAAIGVAMIAIGAQFRYLLAVAMVLYAFIFISAFKLGRSQAATEQAQQTDMPRLADSPANSPSDQSKSQSA